VYKNITSSSTHYNIAAPFQPNVKDAGDTSHFQDIYPEEDLSQLESLDVYFDEF
jgi:hypothetical protein